MTGEPEKTADREVRRHYPRLAGFGLPESSIGAIRLSLGAIGSRPARGPTLSVVLPVQVYASRVGNLRPVVEAIPFPRGLGRKALRSGLSLRQSFSSRQARQQ